MTLFEELKEKLMGTEGSFDLVRAGKSHDMFYHFMQNRIGAARYIYGYDSTDEDAYLSIEANYDLVAIVSDLNDTVYIVNPFFFVSEHGKELPEGMKRFDDFTKELNRRAVDVILPEFMENLVVNSDDYLDEDRMNRCRLEARRALLTGKDSFEITKPATLICKDDAAKILCGYDTVEGIATESLEKNKKAWVLKKAESMKINEFIRYKFEVVTSCELAIAEALRKIGDAKNVTVEFTVGGKTAAEKMCVSTMLGRMITNYKFDDYDFVTQKRGKELLKKLEIGFGFDWFLVPDDISKITYGKKVLYSRETKAA